MRNNELCGELWMLLYSVHRRISVSDWRSIRLMNTYILKAQYLVSGGGRWLTLAETCKNRTSIGQSSLLVIIRSQQRAKCTLVGNFCSLENYSSISWLLKSPRKLAAALTRILGAGESQKEFWPESFLLLKLFYIFDWLCYFALHLLPAHKPLSFTQYLQFKFSVILFLSTWKRSLCKIVLFPKTVGLHGIQRSKCFCHNEIMTEAMQLT